MKHARLTYLSSDEYLALENSSPVKHEYVAGRIHATVGVREHVLIGSKQRSIEVYRPQVDGAWTLTTLEGDEDLELSSIGTNIAAREIYQDVGF